MTVTQKEIDDHLAAGTWKQLQQVAWDMVQDAQEHAGGRMLAKLGGGTRLMLTLKHRISDDIDLFIRDPQWIGCLSPRLNDRFEDLISEYEENSSFLTLHMQGGEINFIVAPSLLGLPDEHSEHTSFLLEPVGEVLAKKLFYRGWALTPRDLFDWWCVSTHALQLVPEKLIADLIQTKQNGIEAALAAISGSTAAGARWDQIKATEKPSIAFAAEWGKRQLAKYHELASQPDRSHDQGNPSLA
jgi:hypothetical protein